MKSTDILKKEINLLEHKLSSKFIKSEIKNVIESKIKDLQSKIPKNKIGYVNDFTKPKWIDNSSSMCTGCRRNYLLPGEAFCEVCEDSYENNYLGI
jgi:hypothetical protein